MKILQITPYFYPVLGGMENHVYEISRRISKFYNVTIFTSNIDRNWKELLPYQKIGSITIKRFKVIFKLLDFATFFPGIFEEVKKSDFDLIHVHAYRHPHNFVPFFAKTQATITPHYPVYPFSTSKRKLFVSFFDVVFGKKVFSLYDKIIALTEGEKLWLKTKFQVPDKKIKIIPNGVSEKYLKKHNPSTFREKFSIPENKFLILSVGRIHYSKGFQDLIEALKYLPQKMRNNILLAIVGPDAGYLNTLKVLVSQYRLKDNVIFTGEISEKLKLSAYEACDLFVLPSYWEGFGIVLLEAMAKDKTVIARDAGGQKWVVPEKKFLFVSVRDLSRKIIQVYTGKLKKTLNYREIIEEKYLWDKIVEQLIKVYEEVLSNHHSL